MTAPSVRVLKTTRMPPEPPCQSATVSIVSPPLLRIPQALRAQVYVACGVLGSRERTIVSLTSACPRTEERQSDAFRVTRNSLLTCRLLSEEGAAELYASNDFFIRVNRNQGLDPLHHLRGSLVRSLTRLTVHLRVAACCIGLYCDRSVRPWNVPPAKPGRDSPLSLATYTDYDTHHAPHSASSADWSHSMLSEWHRVGTSTFDRTSGRRAACVSTSSAMRRTQLRANLRFNS